MVAWLVTLLLASAYAWPPLPAAHAQYCCTARPERQGCPQNTTIRDCVLRLEPTCGLSWGSDCVIFTKQCYPDWCPVAPTDCVANCDIIGPDGTRCFWEMCDDGNQLNTDACLNSCTSASCGDGFVWSAGCTGAACETCDDGNAVETDSCLNTCQRASCGDGFTWKTGCTTAQCEQCDDGNTQSTDSCVSCRNATCGDGFVWAGVEACDTGSASLLTNGSCVMCQTARCGDGYLRTNVEECDAGAANSDVAPNACRSTCKKAYCGDGIIDTGEACDVGLSPTREAAMCCSNCQMLPASCGTCLNQTHATLASCFGGQCVTTAVVPCEVVCDVSSGQCLSGCTSDAQCASDEYCDTTTFRCTLIAAGYNAAAYTPPAEPQSNYAYLTMAGLFLGLGGAALIGFVIFRRWKDKKEKDALDEEKAPLSPESKSDKKKKGDSDSSKLSSSGSSTSTVEKIEARQSSSS